MLNYSAVVIPITKADKDIDVHDPSLQPLSPDDKKNWEACKLRQRPTALTRLPGLFMVS